jgi:hypothetical protein
VAEHGVGAPVDPDGDFVSSVEDDPAGVQEPALQGVWGGGGVAGQPAAERGADGVGEYGEHDVEVDVEVDVERDGAGERVEAERPDRLPSNVAGVPVACPMVRAQVVSRGRSRSEIKKGTRPVCAGQAPSDAGGRYWIRTNVGVSRRFYSRAPSAR